MLQAAITPGNIAIIVIILSIGDKNLNRLPKDVRHIEKPERAINPIPNKKEIIVTSSISAKE